MLTELKVKNAKIKEKSYMIRDERGLYLRVDPSGCKYWIFRYWDNNKEHKLSLGPYPDLSLKDARIKRDELQTARAKGEDLSRKDKKSHLFSSVANEWFKVRMNDKAKSYLRMIKLRLDKYILPLLGSMPLSEITSRDILEICRKD